MPALWMWLLRQLGRHLTAYDLVTFHHRGANYPDALLLDDLLRRYLLRIERTPELFVGDAHRLRRFRTGVDPVCEFEPVCGRVVSPVAVDRRPPRGGQGGDHPRAFGGCSGCALGSPARGPAADTAEPMVRTVRPVAGSQIRAVPSSPAETGALG